ncbi:hypothetical protein [Streptomyces sp. NPDC029003]|uniref:hypothetical protein n=1 Tax=Streptomyces sp. NPDC029003 TaxID=3155125 RepID=UPI0033C74792
MSTPTRLRHATLSVASVFVLVFALPSPASAATGFFQYRIGLPVGDTLHELIDPASAACTNVEEATDLKAAHSPDNGTNGQLPVFRGFNCSGADTAVPAGESRGAGVRFRSFLFS